MTKEEFDLIEDIYKYDFVYFKYPNVEYTRYNI